MLKQQKILKSSGFHISRNLKGIIIEAKYLQIALPTAYVIVLYSDSKAKKRLAES